MNEKLFELAKQAGFLDLYKNELMSPFREDADISGLLDKFAELIVAACADAADAAYQARCEKHSGDYVGEQMGYGEDTGIAAWRASTQKMADIGVEE